MRTQNQRANKRFTLTIRATVINPVTEGTYECVIRDGSITGCKIVCDHVDDLPEQIGLDVPGIEQIIEGRIVWRGEKSAGIAFSWNKTESHDQRRAPRQMANIPALVLDPDFKPVAKCTICDISQTGCRIVIPGDTALPSKIRFEVENLTRAVMARVVWCEDSLAGVEFIQNSQHSDVYVLEDEDMAE